MYLGIDTRTEYSQVAVVDNDGNLQDEIRLANDRLDELAEQYAAAKPPSKHRAITARFTGCLTSIST